MIRALLVALLLPLSSQTLAQPVLGSRSHTNEIESVCSMQSTVVAGIMKRRQAGEPEETVLQDFQQTESFPGSFKTRVREAYSSVVVAPTDKAREIENFRKKHYDECMQNHVGEPSRTRYTLEDWMQNPSGYGIDVQSITETEHNQCTELSNVVLSVVKMTQEGVPEYVIRETHAESNQLYLRNALRYAYSQQQYPRGMSNQIATQAHAAAYMVCFLKKGGEIFKYGKQQ